MSNLQYKHYLLGLLTVVATLNFLDRFVLSLLLGPIKQDLELSDTQLGFLTGFAFALFYAVAGIPIARWADRGNRNTIVTVTTALWSAMVALCGLVGNFTQLLLVRVGVAVGESGALPPAQSLIADFFDRKERPHAMAIYWMCTPMAMIIGYLGGGWLAEAFGWRITFVVIGLPGLLVAILVRLTIREPRLKTKLLAAARAPNIKTVITTLSQQKTYRRIVMASCVSSFFGMGITLWLPTFFMRSHDMEIGEVGAWFALIWGLCGLLGNYVGGYLATRYLAGKEALQMRILAIIFVFGGALYMLVYISSNVYLALICLAATAFTISAIYGPIFSALQSLVSEHMRSIALALILLFSQIIGFGLGPVMAGLLSDLLMPIFGKESLRYALAMFSPGYLWVAYHYWKAGDTIEEDIKQVELEAETTEPKIVPIEAEALELNNGSIE